MKKGWLVLLCSMMIWTSNASASTIELFDWAFNVDGSIYEYGDTLPGEANMTNWDNTTGLGTMEWDISGEGSHSFIAFFDHEIWGDTGIGEGSLSDEFGTASGSLAAGQSWEIDEPGWVVGDIYDNLLYGILDNANGVPSGDEDDVSWAMGWEFDLAANQSALITLTLSDTLPVVLPSFYLHHSDADDSAANIYFYSTLGITDNPPPAVPEPATLLLFGVGLLGIAGFQRKRIVR